MQLLDILKKENIYFAQRFDHWQQAIEQATKPMIEQGYCHACYLDGIMENTKKFGTYYILKDGIALLHASSEQGAIKTQVAITYVNEPVLFEGKKCGVHILLCLVAQDAHSHLALMQSLSNILGDDALYQTLLHAKSVEEIYDVFISSQGNE